VPGRDATVDAASAVFDALAHPVRRDILRLLGEGEHTATGLAEPFAMSRPAVSQHLRILREAGLVQEQRAGRNHIYALNPSALLLIDEWLEHFRHFWPRRLRALDELLRRRTP